MVVDKVVVKVFNTKSQKNDKLASVENRSYNFTKKQKELIKNKFTIGARTQAIAGQAHSAPYISP